MIIFEAYIIVFEIYVIFDFIFFPIKDYNKLIILISGIYVASLIKFINIFLLIKDYFL